MGALGILDPYAVTLESRSMLAPNSYRIVASDVAPLYLTPQELPGAEASVPRLGIPWEFKSPSVVSIDMPVALGVKHLGRHDAGALSPDSSVLGHVSRRYQFSLLDREGAFLEQHQFLIPLLVEAAQQIPAYFGAPARPRLELFTDPESSGEGELFVLIGTALAPEEARSSLRQFDEGWWLDKSPEARCLLNFDIASR